MDTQETILYNELKRLSKVANQRILSLERLTNRKQPFAVKELSDLLYQAGGLTKRKGKSVRASAKQGEYFEMLARVKALNKFLYDSDSISSIRKAKEFKKLREEEFGKKFTFAQASKLYQAQKIRDWALEHFDESDLFYYYNHEFKDKSVSLETFIDHIQGMSSPDDELDVDKLKELYNYFNT